MRFAAAIATATEAGMKLPPRPEPLVTPPPNTRSWMGTEDAGGQGLNAARSVEEDQNSVDPKCIAKAASMAKWRGATPSA